MERIDEGFADELIKVLSRFALAMEHNTAAINKLIKVQEKRLKHEKKRDDQTKTKES